MRTTRPVRCAFAGWTLPKSLLAVPLLCLSTPAIRAQGADRLELAAARASITPEELKGHVDVLADDTFEGREVGSRGGRAAGNYLHQAFERRELSPAGDGGSYFQAFNAASRNVLGLVEGSDPQWKEQVILIGAHYDHVGYGRANNSFGPWGYIHNGADDNASGVAGLLEMVDAVMQLPTKPKRTILFALWDGEEAGLLGSRHWLSRPTVALSRVALAINLDMIGRLKKDRVEVYGARTAAGLRRLVSEANDSPSLGVHFDWKLKSDSDHWPFYERRIPILMFHTGLHEDYHRPSDDAHRINHAGLTEVARLALDTVLLLAEAPQLPAFRDAVRRESAATGYALEQPVQPQPPRFGMPFHVIPAVAPGEPAKFVLAQLSPGYPAERGGLRAGDRVLEFQGQAVTDENRFRLELLAARGETTFLVERPGLDTPQLFKVTPLGEPVRVGINWRLDDGEPGTAILTQVLHGSAAQLAGLQVGDRVYSVAGRSFQTQDQFIALLMTSPGPLEMRVERNGQVRAATLAVLDELPAAE